jgi:hypothetical protein
MSSVCERVGCMQAHEGVVCLPYLSYLRQLSTDVSSMAIRKRLAFSSQSLGVLQAETFASCCRPAQTEIWYRSAQYHYRIQSPCRTGVLDATFCSRRCGCDAVCFTFTLRNDNVKTQGGRMIVIMLESRLNKQTWKFQGPTQRVTCLTLFHFTLDTRRFSH